MYIVSNVSSEPKEVPNIIWFFSEVYYNQEYYLSYHWLKWNYPNKYQMLPGQALFVTYCYCNE